MRFVLLVEIPSRSEAAGVEDVDIRHDHMKAARTAYNTWQAQANISLLSRLVNCAYSLVSTRQCNKPGANVTIRYGAYARNDYNNKYTRLQIISPNHLFLGYNKCIQVPQKLSHHRYLSQGYEYTPPTPSKSWEVAVSLTGQQFSFPSNIKDHISSWQRTANTKLLKLTT